MSRVIKQNHLIRDRDYLLDNCGRFLKVVGDNHPENKIVSYVKYFPTNVENRLIKSKKYGYNSFVSKSFVILNSEEDRTCFSDYHGGVITCTPIGKVERVFSCKDRLKEIWAQKHKYINHKVGSELIGFVEAALNHVDISDLGITGSFLIDGFTDSSDIDLVCYGYKAYSKLKGLFYHSKHVIPYTGKYGKNLYKRRMIHMEPMDYELFIKQENRKLQGLTPKNKVHVNCQPLRNDEDDFFDSIKFIEVGEIQCIANIIGNKQGIYAPAYYEIEVVDIIDSLFADGGYFEKEIKAFISYIGTYACSFEKGDRVFIKGKLVKVNHNGDLYYAIELSPWNTERVFSAKLLK